MTRTLRQTETSPGTDAVAQPGTGDERRFRFGENWRRFVVLVDEDRIAAAESDLRAMLGVDDLAGLSFLDAGCGSGLASLAARRLGARVVSFDLDPDSVMATESLRSEHFGAEDEDWVVLEGSVLDCDFLEVLGEFDVVHSWGVLHHTGAMWEACTAIARCVAPGGRLFIALYNDQGAWSERWKRIKRLYCSGTVGRLLVTGLFVPGLHLRRFAADVVWLRNPFRRLRRKKARGMSPSHDMRDWLGGYPFEVAKPEAVFEFYRDRGFDLEKLKTVGGSLGCNVFVFQRDPAAGAGESS
jgi:2-polyprenyl-3-methyl-5-hydroxy-6-metoxy-1,4-benzoquinol methylase